MSSALTCQHYTLSSWLGTQVVFGCWVFLFILFYCRKNTSHEIYSKYCNYTLHYCRLYVQCCTAGLQDSLICLTETLCLLILTWPLPGSAVLGFGTPVTSCVPPWVLSPSPHTFHAWFRLWVPTYSLLAPGPGNRSISEHYFQSLENVKLCLPAAKLHSIKYLH